MKKIALLFLAILVTVPFAFGLSSCSMCPHKIVTDPRVEPTATTTGLTEGSHCSICHEVFVAQNVIPMLPAKASISVTGFNFAGNSISGIVNNSTLKFDLSAYIHVFDQINWYVSSDIGGEASLDTQNLQLAEGNNTFYVHIINNDQSVDSYVLNVYRNHLYTVQFNSNGGTEIDTLIVEEGSLINEPITTRQGYIFAGWDFDFNKPINSNIIINANWLSDENTQYKVKYYLQNIDQTGFDLDESLTETHFGATDIIAYATPKQLEHFTIDQEKSTLSGTVKSDGSLVLEVYCLRNVYTVSATHGTILNHGDYPYQNEVTLSVDSANLGYVFSGWYTDDDTLLSNETDLTIYIEGNIEARFDVLPEMRNFVFTSTLDTCSIYGIFDKTVTELSVPDYVTTIHEGAFRGCSSLEKITIPFVGKEFKKSGESHQYPFGYIFGTESFDGSLATEQFYYGADLSTTTNTTYYIPQSLSSVTIINGNLLYGAFYNCNRLSDIVIPENAETVETHSFYNCSALTELVIPKTVMYIGSSALSGCSSIESLTIPFVGDSRKTASDDHQYPLGHIFGTDYFENTWKTSQHYYAYQGTITSYKDYMIPKSLKSVTVTDGNILCGAFYFCSYIDQITLPENAEMIGNWAFRGCKQLDSITIPENIKSIGATAFEDCITLKKVYFNAISMEDIDSANYLFKGAGSNVDGIDIVIGASVKKIPARLFHASDSIASNFKSLEFEEGCVCESIGAYAFSYCDKISGTVNLPQGLVTISSDAFYKCEKINAITIPDSTVFLDNNVFLSCSSLTQITVGKNNTAYMDVDGVLYSKDGKKLIIYPIAKPNTQYDILNGVTDICENAFSQCVNLINVTIPDGVTEIPKKAFSDCSNIVEIIIPDSVIHIRTSAFAGCVKLAKLILGENVETLEYYSFNNCISLTDVFFPKKVHTIDLRDGEFWAFMNCTNLASITVSKDNPYYTDIDGNLYSKDGKTLIQYAIGKPDTVFNIPYGVTTIGSNAFHNSHNLHSINMPDSITEIKIYGFSDCKGLTAVTIPGSVEIMAKRAFQNCSSLVNVTISEGITTIDEYTFSHCHSLNSVSIPNTVTSIKNYAFQYCYNLTSITIPESVEKIDYKAFDYCYKLVEIINKPSITLNSWITRFALEIHNGETKMVNQDDYVFYTYEGTNYLMGYAGTDSKLILPASYNGESYKIYNYAFYYNANITEVVIPQNVTHVGNCAFAYCESLTTLTIFKGVQKLGDNSLSNCSNLKTINYTGSLSDWKSITKGSSYTANSTNFVIIYDYTEE